MDLTDTWDVVSSPDFDDDYLPIFVLSYGPGDEYTFECERR
jgi:hypothetical protein